MERETVELRWLADVTRGLEVSGRADPKHRVIDLDMRPIGMKQHLHVTYSQQQIDVLVLTPAAADDERHLLAIPTLFEMGNMSSNLGKPIPPKLGVVRGRWLMTDTGLPKSEKFSETDRSVFGVALELPTAKVGVGDEWKIEGGLLGPSGDAWTVDDNALTGGARLMEIRHEAKGSRVAVVDYDRTESIKGHFSSLDPKRPIPLVEATYTSHLKGHGEFLVEKGVWRAAVFSSETASSGLGKTDLRLTLSVRSIELSEALQQAVSQGNK